MKKGITVSLATKWIAVTLMLGLLVTVLAARQLAQSNDQSARETVRATSQRVVDDALARIRLYQYGLRGARGAVFTAGERRITRALFNRYIRTREIDNEFPGARGFGFIRRVPRADENSFLQQARADDWPDFAIRELNPNDGERYVIQYIEPVARNWVAVGLDIASETNRREAADAAMLTGQARLSGPITLVQATGAPLQSFLILLPIYRTVGIPATLAERKAQTFGWSYAALNMNEVLADLPLDSSLFHLQLRDLTSSGTGELFYDTASRSAGAAELYTQTFEHEVYGRRWQVTLSATPLFVRNLHQLQPRLVLLLGLMATLLAAALSGTLAQSRQRKQQIAAEQARMATIVQCSSDAIIGEALDGTITTWNKAAERLFGYDAAHAVGQRLAPLLIPAERWPEDADMLSRVARGENVETFDTQRLRRDGSLMDMAVTAGVILDVDGRVQGAAKLLHDISDRKAAERRLVEFNAKLEQQVLERTTELDSARTTLRTVLDAVPSLIGYWDKGLINRVANRTYGVWFDIEPGKLPGTHMRDLVGETLYRENLPFFEAALRGEPQVFESAIPMPDGQGMRHALAQYLPDVVEGEVRGFYSVVHDVTDLVESRLQLAQVVRENEELLHTINEQMSYSVVDLAGNIIEVNDNFCRISGYTRQELLGQHHRIVASEIHPSAFWKSMWDSISAGKAWHADICNRTKDGRLHWFDSVVAPFVDANGEIERYVVLGTDITAKKVAESERNTFNVLLSNVLRSASEISIIATDVDGLIRIFNTGAERMLGYRADEVVDRCSPAILHLPEEVAARGAQLSAEYGMPVEGFRVFVHKAEIEGAQTGEWTYVRKDGSRVQVSLVITAMRDDAGCVTGFLGVAQDISRRKEFERYLLDARHSAEQASVTKSQFLANMSHEIRTPLNAVLGMLQLVHQTELNGRQLDYVSKAQTAARSLLGLLNDVLDFSKIEAGKLQLDLHPFSLEALMRELGVVLSGNQISKDVEVMFDLDPTLPASLIGDSLRLQQVLINLAGNALKFTQAGHVVVSVKVLHLTDNAVTLRIAVKDTGIGISAEQLTYIFDGFRQAEASVTRRFGGTGLGLVISKRLVELMGGNLEVQSEPGEGSSFGFDITLDVADSSLLDAGSGSDKASIRILVVDDNALTSEILGRTCASLGWQVDSASGGNEALELVQEAWRTGENYDVVLMDWRMPDLDGVSAAALIQDRARTASMPVVIMISADGLEALAGKKNATDAPFVDFLCKPVTPQQLAEAVRHALSGKAPASATLHTPAERRQRLSGMQLLVVEDNALNRQVAEELLLGEGAIVQLAEGGLEGVDRVRHGPQAFDAVIMDVQMPDIDGLEATGRIRADARFADLPILAMTANASTSDRDMCLAAGMNAHTGKPIDLDKLVSALLALTGRDASDSQGVLPPESAAAGDGTIELFESILVRFGGNIDLFARLLNNFQTEAARLLVDLDTGVQQDNTADTAAALHTLKGVAGTMGATALATRAVALEQQLKTSNGQAVAEVVDAGALSELDSLLHASTACLTAAVTEARNAHLPAAAADEVSAVPVVWRTRLMEILPLLESGNLKAIELVEALPAVPEANDRTAFDTLMTQVQALEFAAATMTMRAMLEENN